MQGRTVDSCCHVYDFGSRIEYCVYEVFTALHCDSCAIPCNFAEEVMVIIERLRDAYWILSTPQIHSGHARRLAT